MSCRHYRAWPAFPCAWSSGCVAAASTDSKMRMNPVHRQRLPASPSRISAMVGCGVRSSSCAAAISMPGVQMPHCAPPQSRNACCNRCSVPLVRQPFNRLNLSSLGLQHRHQAAVHQLAVHAHRARAAFAFAASFLGSRQVQVFTQHIKQALERRRLHGARFAVQVELDCRR